MQFNFKKARRYSNLTKLRFLSPPEAKGNDITQAWHATYVCTGIQYCSYTNQDIIKTSPAYDRVKLEDIGAMRRQAQQALISRELYNKLRQRTIK